MIEEDIKLLVEKGEIDGVIDLLLPLNEKLDILLNLIWVSHDITISGNPQKAIRILRDYLTISEKLQIPEAVSLSLSSMTFAYALLGDFSLAFECLERSLPLCKPLQNRKWIYAFYLNMSGVYYHLTGDLVKAEKDLKEKISIDEELNNEIGLPWGYYNLARVYKHKYEFDESLAAFNKSLPIFEEKEDILGIACTLFQIILIKLELKLRDEAKDYLQKLKGQSDRNHLQANVRINLAEGLILKSGHRAVHKTEAQKLFEKIISDEIVDHEMTVIAMLNLCELLIEEIRTYREEEAISEFEELIEGLLKISKDYNSYSLYVDILLIKSRYQLVMGNSKEAETILEQGFILTEEEGLKEIAAKVIKELKILESEIRKWDEMGKNNLSLPDRMNQIELESYINRALKTLGRI
ncbi:MAG: tetratricopeptide repeat protein [Candidatus Hodarchaeales archaeon]|jgi:tetratricopeptide (TPR) repeat protein